MGTVKPAPAWFIADANVLIDYAQTSPEILTLVAKHLGVVHVAAAVLDEVGQIDAAQCRKMGLRVVDGTLAQLMEASRRGGALSFEDKLCLVLARENGWTCLSNDVLLRNACVAQGVSVLWGLEIMLQLIEAGHLDVDQAIAVADAIHAVNPLYITQEIVRAFRCKAQHKGKKAE